ncbi:MAG: type II secretion system F family protein [Lachnospiraceae bacterium]|nr:type II secretion system F family protein [Lachnospiraceae bacterium]
MPIYAYEAVDATGTVVKNSYDADSEDAVRMEIKRLGMTAISIQKQTALNKSININIGGKPKTRDLSVFCRQMTSMVRAGVTMIDSLKMMAESTENRKLREAIEDVRVSVEKGESVSAAFSEHPDVFSEFMVNMVQAGEASGSIDIAFERMALQLEKSGKTQAIIKKAMVYPIVVVVVMIAVVIVMLVKVIPSYASMFADLGTDLPAITKGVQAVSNFIIHYWFIIVPIIVAIAVGTATYSRTDSGKHFFGKIAIKFPAIKVLVIKSASAMAARTLSTLVAAGIPLVEAVEISAKVMTNVYFKEALMHAKEEILIGQPLSRPLEESGLFPPMVYHMVRIGEETGQTEEMLDRCADYYEEETEMAVQAMMAALEPMIIIVLAGVVGIILGACMAPMLTMYQALDSL